MRNWDIFSLEKRIFELEKSGAPTPSGDGEIYADTETKIGTFMGEDLYRIVKTVSVSSFTANTAMVVASSSVISSLNIDKLIRAFCVITSSTATSPVGTVADSFWIDGDGNIKTKPYSGYLNITDCKLVIEYTKKAPAKTTKRSAKK